MLRKSLESILEEMSRQRSGRRDLREYPTINGTTRHTASPSSYGIASSPSCP